MNIGPLLIVEIVWTITALFGFSISIYNLFDLMVDRNVLVRARLNGLRRMSVNGSVRAETVRCYAHFIMVVIGGLSLAVPNNPNERASVVSWLFRLALLTLNWALVYNTIADNILRRKIFSYAEEAENRSRLPDEGAHTHPEKI